MIWKFVDPANDAAKSDDKTTNGVAEREVEREPEEITYTLDEWKAQQAKKDETKFNLRKAGEGSDLDPKWKKTYAYKKEKETHDEEDEEVSNFSQFEFSKSSEEKISRQETLRNFIYWYFSWW